MKEREFKFCFSIDNDAAKQLAGTVRPMKGHVETVESYHMFCTENDIKYALLMPSHKKKIKYGFDNMYEWLINCERTLLGTAVRDEAELRELLTQIREIRNEVCKAKERLAKL